VDDHSAHANSFGPAADIYERGRPGYPDAAVTWLLPAGRPRVVDLGAGTGKLTRQIRDRGLEVTAVDPSEQMLAQLALAVPGVPALIGSAERIPLPAGSADAVLVAQAWHWIDPARAVPEIARILRPGGRLGLVWNLRDESEPWVRRLDEIIGDSETERATTVFNSTSPVVHVALTRLAPWVLGRDAVQNKAAPKLGGPTRRQLPRAPTRQGRRSRW